MVPICSSQCICSGSLCMHDSSAWCDDDRWCGAKLRTASKPISESIATPALTSSGFAYCSVHILEKLRHQGTFSDRASYLAVLLKAGTVVHGPQPTPHTPYPIRHTPYAISQDLIINPRELPLLLVGLPTARHAGLPACA